MSSEEEIRARQFICRLRPRAPGTVSDVFVRSLLALTGGLPLLAVSAILLKIWIDPLSVAGGDWVMLGAMIIMVEFLLLHSGAFMAVGPVVCRKTVHQVAWFFGFGALYAGFFIGVAVWVGKAYVVWLLAGVMLSRLLTLLILRDKRGTLLMLQRSAFGIMILLLSMFVVFIPFPELGISESIRQQIFGRPSDMLSEHPERFLAWGVTYFTLTGMIETWVGWHLPDWKDEDVEKGWVLLGK